MIKSRFRQKRSAEGKPSIFGGVFLCLFGLIFAIAGGFFLVSVIGDFAKTADARGWNQVPAELIEADIEVSRGQEAPFAIRVEFAYSFEGRDYTSDRFALKKHWSGDYEELALELRDLRGRDVLVAYVNPDNPSESVLDPGTLASGFQILIPLVFIVVGLGCFLLGILSFRGAKGGASSGSAAEAISSAPTDKKGGAVVGVIIGSIFAVVGLGLLYPFGIRPFVLAGAAENWVETPCEIIWAKVQSHEGDDSTTYSVDIFYAYEFDGVKHRSNRDSFVGGSSSGYQGKKEVADRYRAMEAPVCFVDPELPERAVLKRELGAGGFLALIPAGFLLIGSAVAVFSYRHWKKERGLSDDAGGADALGRGSGGEHLRSKILKPSQGRVVTMVVVVFAALFWNGIVFGFLFPAAWLQDGGIFLKLFSLPFMLVGVLLVVAIPYNALALFNPKPVLTLEPGEPELGVPATLTWHFEGAAGRLRTLSIVVRGHERATYRRGTSTSTDTRCFYAAEIAGRTDRLAVGGGRVEFTLPLDLMYSLELANNAIAWNIDVEGEIPFWPDVKDSFEITVRPQTHTLT